jgi:hypothetical protein
MHNFGVKLHTVYFARFVLDGGGGACGRGSQNAEAFGRNRYEVAMRHPDFLVIGQAGKQTRIPSPDVEECEAELTLISLADVASEKLSYELLAVADAEGREARGENGGIHGGAGMVVNAAGPAGDDDAAYVAQCVNGCFAGINFGGHAEFPHLAGNQVAVLTPGV